MGDGMAWLTNPLNNKNGFKFTAKFVGVVLGAFLMGAVVGFAQNDHSIEKNLPNPKEPAEKKVKSTEKKSPDMTKRRTKMAFKMLLEYKLGIQKSKTELPDSSTESQLNTDLREAGPLKPPQKASQAFWNIMFQSGETWSLNTRFRLFPDRATNLLDRGFLRWHSAPQPRLNQSIDQEKGVPVDSTMTSMDWSLAVGRDVLRLGGFENQNLSLSPLPLSTYQEYRLPFRDQSDRRSVDGLVLSTGGFFGKVDLQMMKDVQNTTYSNDRKEFSWAYSDSKSRKVAAALQWIYTLKRAQWGLSPLVQVGRYDAFQSTYFGTGVQIESGKANLSVDIAQDKRAINQKFYEWSGTSQEHQFVQTRFGTLQGRFQIGDWEPFVKGSQFTTMQPKIDHLGNTDTKTFDDQSLDGYVGTSWDLGPLKPYGWLQWQRQKIIDQPRNPFVTSVVETQAFELGIIGEL